MVTTNLNIGDWIMYELWGLVTKEFVQVKKLEENYINVGEKDAGDDWSLEHGEFKVLGYIPEAVYSDELARKTQASVFAIIVGDAK